MTNLDIRNFVAVIITGGSSGIGHEFIRFIFNVTDSTEVCNLSREKPDDFLKNPRFTHCSCDLSEAGNVRQAASFIEGFLSEKVPAGPVLLINNSGFGSYGSFSELDLAREVDMLAVNISAVVHLTGLLLPLIIKRQGAIINIASTAAFQPTPYLATYGATKAFVLHWSLSLAEELRPQGVHVLAVCPGPTATSFFKNAGFSKPILGSGAGQLADAVVREALQALKKGKHFVVTGWKNKWIAFMSSKMPKVFAAWLSGIILKRIRYGALQKGKV